MKLIKSSKFKEEWNDDLVYWICGSEQPKGPIKSNKKDEPCLLKELQEAGYILSVVDGYGGEGCGDYYWGVFSIEHGNDIEYIKLSGWYASYCGAEVDIWDWEPVKKVPVERYEWVSVEDDK